MEACPGSCACVPSHTQATRISLLRVYTVTVGLSDSPTVTMQLEEPCLLLPRIWLTVVTLDDLHPLGVDHY